MQSSYFERNVFLHGLIIIVYALYIEEKPTFVFESLFNSGVFDSSYPIYHILEKLIQVDKENRKRCQNESTFDWDLFLTNLLVKITAYFCISSIIRLSIYHSSKEVPSSYVGLSSSPIVLQLIYYSLLSVAMVCLSYV